MKPVILLVDDVEEILEFLTSDLKKLYDVRTAHNGQEALEILTVESVQLIVSDIMMPIMDGFELCKALKSNVENSHIPIILLTAKDTFQSKMEGLEHGADAYIDKPFSPLHLRLQIENLLNNRNKIKEYFANSPLVHIKSMAYSKADERFLEELNTVILAHLEETELDVDQLAKAMNMSRPTLYRKISSISDLSPKELINIARLKKAAQLLVDGDFKINDIAEMVGYSSANNFARNFLKQFGINPSEYAGLKHKHL